MICVGQTLAPTFLGLVDPFPKGDYLVVYMAGRGVKTAVLEAATRWPLPTIPRTTFVVVGQESATRGFIRVLIIDEIGSNIREAMEPLAKLVRVVVVDPCHTVLAVLDSADPAVIRSQVSIALATSRVVGQADAKRVYQERQAMVHVLSDRAEVLLSPLVRQVSRIDFELPVNLGSQPMLDLEVQLYNESAKSEAIERLVGVGYGFVGNLGIVGRDLLEGPEDEPVHRLHVVAMRPG